MRKGIYTLHLIYSTLLGLFCVPGSLFCLLLFPSTKWCDLSGLLIESAVCVNKFAIPRAAYVGNCHDQVAWWQQALCELGCWFLWKALLSWWLRAYSLALLVFDLFFFPGTKEVVTQRYQYDPALRPTWFFCQCHKAALCFSSLSWKGYGLMLKCLWFEYEAQFPVLPLKKKSQLILLINHL